MLTGLVILAIVAVVVYYVLGDGNPMLLKNLFPILLVMGLFTVTGVINIKGGGDDKVKGKEKYNTPPITFSVLKPIAIMYTNIPAYSSMKQETLDKGEFDNYVLQTIATYLAMYKHTFKRKFYDSDSSSDSSSDSDNDCEEKGRSRSRKPQGNSNGKKSMSRIITPQEQQNTGKQYSTVEGIPSVRRPEPQKQKHDMSQAPITKNIDSIIHNILYSTNKYNTMEFYKTVKLYMFKPLKHGVIDLYKSIPMKLQKSGRDNEISQHKENFVLMLDIAIIIIYLKHLNSIGIDANNLIKATNDFIEFNMEKIIVPVKGDANSILNLFFYSFYNDKQQDLSKIISNGKLDLLITFMAGVSNAIKKAKQTSKEETKEINRMMNDIIIDDLENVKVGESSSVPLVTQQLSSIENQSTLITDGTPVQNEQNIYDTTQLMGVMS